MTESEKQETKGIGKPERKKNFANLSDIEIKRLYTPEDIEDLSYVSDLAEILIETENMYID